MNKQKLQELNEHLLMVSISVNTLARTVASVIADFNKEIEGLKAENTKLKAAQQKEKKEKKK